MGKFLAWKIGEVLYRADSSNWNVFEYITKKTIIELTLKAGETLLPSLSENVKEKYICKWYKLVITYKLYNQVFVVNWKKYIKYEV